MNAEVKAKIISLVQGRIDGFHTTKARGYVSETPNGNQVNRIGMSVYLEKDEQVTAIGKVLAQLSEEGKAGHPDPIIVNVDGTDFVVVGCQFSNDDKNFSQRPKVILADHLIGSNAEVSQEERAKSIRLQQEIRETNKNLKSEVNKVRKQLQAVTEEDFDSMLQ